ncbi:MULTISPECIES: gamma-glutamyltransferase [Bacillus]|uniref:Glutathione hydrolase proenzyme n=2 Tax=Bacillus TaxID=1386 RepID=A0A0M4FK78_9BACI|nr:MULTISPECIES: gamma-glutamyltransferase [Bacillus]ALC83699.1 gamma-glutamyltranspeptidase [Bacillus gobiensis]MBP1082736.1 gamma-glutamyltranspeptidase/glutathione hydrolase [Bacillus capparidis]MED1097047.1 gamma-glutamyltransferase [Bacillus capparidis]
MNQSLVGSKTMVVSPHYLASSAGNTILLRGGNAFDAAVAVSACLAVVYPHMTGLGGDSFWLTYCSKEQKARAYNGSGRAGSKADREFFSGLDSIPYRGIKSIITVPGMIDSWDAILKKYGRLTLAEVLAPAIEYAASGFPLSNDQYENTVQRADVLRQDSDTASIFLPDNRLPNKNERFVQRNLANTLKQIAEKGRDEFYKGELAKRIVTSLQEKGGLLTFEDFSGHSGNWTEPISASYRDCTMFQVPPNSQGFAGLMILNILENYDLASIPHGSYEYYHLLTEVIKASFQDRNAVLTDPDFHPIPLEKLLSASYASEMAQSIDFSKAKDSFSEPVGNDTAYAAVVDEEGNCVSFIQSIYFEFGSGVVAGDTGIIMQNRGSFFSLDPSHVNRLEPNKRTFHTLMPAMACKNGKPYILYGTQGGEGQPQTQAAIITRMLDYHMNPQQAINEPRFLWGRTWGEATQELKLESRISQNVSDELEKAGHIVNRVAEFDGVMGHAHAILIDEQGFLHAGVDPRSDGEAVGR